MLFAPALLLFTTLTSVGLIAAWAATSPRHWFVRTMAFLAVASLPLLIPAYEMFVAFVLQGLVVAVGVQAWRWRRDRADGKGARFALRDALLAVVPLAIVSAVAVRLPALDVPAWANVCAIGCFGGLVTLLALWAVAGKWQSPLLRGMVSALGALLLAAPGAAFDNALDSVTQQLGWPTQRSVLAPFIATDPPGNVAWIGIAPAAFLSLILLCLLLGATRADRRPQRPFGQRLAIGSGLVLALSSAALPLFTLIALANPLPIPDEPPPEPNGFDDYLSAIAAVPANPIVDNLGFDPEAATLPRLQAAAAEGAAAIALVRAGLGDETWRPLDYTAADLSNAQLTEMRGLARLMETTGIAKAKSGDADAAAADFADLTLFGSSQCRGGLLVDMLVGIACGGVGCRGLHEVRDDASHDRRRDVIAKLLEAETLLESFEKTLLRDRVWSQHAYAWHGHLCQLVGDMNGEDYTPSMKSAYDRYLAVLRILRTEYALLQYRDRHGALPDSLSDIPADILRPLPTDPFASDGAPLRYRRTDDGYLVYSVWVDGVDDAGRAPEPFEGFTYWGEGNLGDLSLDALYRDETFTPSPATEPVEDDPGFQVYDAADGSQQ